MNLSKNFTLEELIESPTARRLGYTEQFSPPQNIVTNLTSLCTHILQPLRDKAGPISTSSGWRCERANKAVGGSVTSQHMSGMAADISAIKGTNALLFKKIQELGLPWDQLIWEYGTKTEPAWVHVSFNPNGKPRKQILYTGV